MAIRNEPAASEMAGRATGHFHARPVHACPALRFPQCANPINALAPMLHRNICAMRVQHDRKLIRGRPQAA
jgi:hypothetical protein